MRCEWSLFVMAKMCGRGELVETGKDLSHSSRVADRGLSTSILDEFVVSQFIMLISSHEINLHIFISIW